jgi:hypothetical protein
MTVPGGELDLRRELYRCGRRPAPVLHQPQAGRLPRPGSQGPPVPEREQPVEPYVAPALGDEIFMHAPIDDGWLVVMRRNLPDRPIEWYLQHCNQDLSELISQSQHPYPTEGQAVMSDLHRRGIWLDWRRGTPAPNSDG